MLILTIPREYFQTSQYLFVSTAIGLICAFVAMSKNNKQLLKGTTNIILPFVLTIFLIFYIGRRPITCYGDTWLYTMMFNMVQTGEWHALPSSTDPFWLWFHNIFVDLGSASDWLLGVASFYIGGMALATYRWLPQHFFVGLMFCFTSFSFYAFATNGIRAGMATSMAMVAISLINIYKKEWSSNIIALALLIMAYKTHSSLAITIASALIAFFLKDSKLAFKIWLICLVLGFLFNSTFQSLFSWVSSNEKMAHYANMIDVQYNKMYFRWDFIVYSALPIVLGYITTIKKKITDGKYTFLLNTYIIANSFWLLINEIAYSNRYAYLSWFLYPIVVAYPLCKFEIFKNQGQITGMILIGLMTLTIIL